MDREIHRTGGVLLDGGVLFLAPKSDAESPVAALALVADPEGRLQELAKRGESCSEDCDFPPIP